MAVIRDPFRVVHELAAVRRAVVNEIEDRYPRRSYETETGFFVQLFLLLVEYPEEAEMEDSFRIERDDSVMHEWTMQRVETSEGETSEGIVLVILDENGDATHITSEPFDAVLVNALSQAVDHLGYVNVLEGLRPLRSHLLPEFREKRDRLRGELVAFLRRRGFEIT